MITANLLEETKCYSQFFSLFCQKNTIISNYLDRYNYWIKPPSIKKIERFIGLIFQYKQDITDKLCLLRQTIWAILVFQHHHKIIEFEELANIISISAKKIIHASHDYLLMINAEHLTRKPDPLLILAMGKLGGNELNFSSDIDLIFSYHSDDVFFSNNKEISALKILYKIILSINRYVKLCNETRVYL